MKSTGVVRRIDDLGRIVIPKEIRKTMRIKDGESLEIFLESNNIILKKYSDLEDLANFYKLYIDSLSTVLDKEVLVFDRNKLIALSDNIKEGKIGLAISSFLDELITSRELYVSRDKEMVSFINSIDVKCYYAVDPIIVNGDIVGVVVIFSEQDMITDFDIKILKLSVDFFSKYIE